MLTGDINIDMLRPSDHLTNRYQGILDMFELTQIVKRPTRVTRTSKTLIDHFITNHPQKVTNTGIIPIPCSIESDHDAIYACVNVRLPRFQPRYKFIRDMRNFKEDMLRDDFSSLLLSVISYSDDPDEQLETLNTLISECLERHAPLRKVRVTRPPAPWMKDPLIEELQKKRDAARFTAHQTSIDVAWHEFRSVRNTLKLAITTARKAFIEKALYSNKSREVWTVIHRVLKPNARPLRFDPDEINDFFETTAQRTLETRATPIEDLTCLIDNLPDAPPPQGFVFSAVICHQWERSPGHQESTIGLSYGRGSDTSPLHQVACRVFGSPLNIYHQQLHCESLFSKAVEDFSSVSSPKD